jgi:hypothetical protein
MGYETLMERLQEIQPREDFPKKEEILVMATNALETAFTMVNSGLSIKKSLEKLRVRMDKLQKVPLDTEALRNFATISSLAELEASILINRVRNSFDSVEKCIQDLYRFGYTREAMEYAERYRSLLQQMG